MNASLTYHRLTHFNLSRSLSLSLFLSLFFTYFLSLSSFHHGSDQTDQTFLLKLPRHC
jgi:hypothetical protein